MEAGIVAETVDDTEVQSLRAESETTVNALRKMNREVGALRQELQRTKEEQTSRRGMRLWRKLCLLSLAVVFIGGVVATVLALTAGGGSDSDAQQATVNAPPEATKEPTAQATTAVPTTSATLSPTIDIFLPPSQDVCSAVSEGRPVDGQDDLIPQPFSVSMNVNLTVDVESGIWWPGLQRNLQRLVMPPVVGCGNTTLDVFIIGYAQVDEYYLSVIPCIEEEQETDGSCYIVELQVVLFLKQVETFDVIDNLSQQVEEVFKNNTNLVLDAQDEDSKTIKDIETLTSKPVTESPSHQPSTNPSDDPSASPSSNPSESPSLQPTNRVTPGPTTRPTPPQTPGPTLAPVSGPTLPPTPGPTPGPTSPVAPIPTQLPTLGPTQAPVSGPTLTPTPLPTPGPSLAPSIGPSAAPSKLPTPEPSLAPSIDLSAVPSKLPTPGPSIKYTLATMAPTPGPTTATPTPAPSTDQPSQTPSSSPSSKRMALEARLARFAPFTGNKGKAMDWLEDVDTWGPPQGAVDEIACSLLLCNHWGWLDR